ncbi:MAG: hypothetical protein ACK52V_04630 [Betaproteobacteria bacterium]
MNEKSDNLKTLREALFATLNGVKDGTLDLDRARAVNEVAKTIVDTAKVEVDYLRTTGAEGSSEFIQAPEKPAALPPGVLGITTHRMRG